MFETMSAQVVTWILSILVVTSKQNEETNTFLIPPKVCSTLTETLGDSIPCAFASFYFRMFQCVISLLTSAIPILQTGYVTRIQNCCFSKNLKIPSEEPKALSRFQPITSNCRAIIQGVLVVPKASF